MHVRYFEENENNYRNWHCSSESDIFIKFMEWLTFYDWNKNKKASLLLPVILFHSQKTIKNVATVLNGIAGKISTMPNHETDIICFLCNLWRIILSEVFLKTGAPKN